MLELRAASFYEVITHLQHLNGFILAKKNEHSLRMEESARTNLSRDIEEELISHLTALEARVTIEAANDLLYAVREQGITWGEFSRGLSDIHNTLSRELKQTTIYVIEAEKRKFLLPQRPLFGKEFETRFTSAAYELDESAKCLALGRPTACVFHLMRLMEISVRAVARCLQISDPIQPADRSWGAVLKKIRDGINAKWPTVASRASGDGAMFEDLYATLDAVKNPWRNATMHVENKYTDDEAEHVFAAVRGFIAKLASRCDENGGPKA